MNASDTRAFLRKSETIGKQGFAKGSYAPSQNDMITFTFLNDPQTRSADTDASVANSRVRRREQGGNNFSTGYNRVWNAVLLEGGLNYHNAAISDFAVNADKSRNTVAFTTSDVPHAGRRAARRLRSELPGNPPDVAGPRLGAISVVAAHLQGRPRVDAARITATESTGPDKAQYTSISSRYLPTGGVTAGNISTATNWSTRQFRTGTASDFNGLIARINTLPNRAAFYTAYDTDGNGTITAAELNSALIFNSTAGNPDGQINYYRTQEAPGLQEQRIDGRSFFGQDEFAFNRFTFSVGLRGRRLEALRDDRRPRSSSSPGRSRRD